MHSTLPIHDGLAAFADDYDAFILDLWGVLHDGVRAYPEAVACLRALKARGKPILVLSNAPRPAHQVAAKMRAVGIPDDAYDNLMSSGEDAWRHLARRSTPWYQALGQRMYHLGPERDDAMCEGVDAEVVSDIDAADFMLNTGPPNDERSVDPLIPLLERAVARGVPMICANPDKVVMRGDTRELCAGSVAERYEALGGTVVYHGKPHPPIYRTCFAMLGDPDVARVAAVGDSLHTDIAGAHAMGMAGIMITGGIHAEALGVRMGERPEPGALTALCSREGIWPTAALPALRWCADAPAAA
jgi:HAD superfamily hydrolase (TIGR01459 family)